VSTVAASGAAPRGRRPARFAIVGATATAVDLGLVLLLVDPLGRLVADLIALASAAAVSRLLHERITLRGDRLDRWIHQPPVFATVAILAGGIDLVVFLSLGSLSTWAAKAIALTAAAGVRAIAHRAVLFRAVRRAQGRPSRRPQVESSVRLSVVVPAYREEFRIADTVAALRRDLAVLGPPGSVEILVVDDGSGDATSARARGAGADQVLTFPENRGKGAAVRAGVAAASGATIAFTDADLAYPPTQLIQLVEEIEAGWDVVIGDRYHPATLTLRGQSSVRSLGSRLVNFATHVLLRGNYRDTQCGLKAFRGDVAELVFGAGTIDGFAFDIELLHLVERYGLSLEEVPVQVANTETSTVRAVRDGLAVGRDILVIRRRSRRGRYPRLEPGVLPAGLEAGPHLDVDQGQRR
jgi:dolichyl-phosphate beta-glucosyltransferase